MSENKESAIGASNEVIVPGQALSSLVWKGDHLSQCWISDCCPNPS